MAALEDTTAAGDDHWPRDDGPSCGNAGAALLAAVRLGDRAAFRELYDAYAAEVLALCQRILREYADAEDAVAEVFSEVWLRRERYDPRRGGARAYLMTLARSRAIDLLRSKRARPETKYARSTPTPPDATLPVRGPAPDATAAHAELRGRVVEALAELDGRQREAMQLAYYEGLSHQQIAERTTLPLGTVKTHIRKGLLKLRYVLRTDGVD